jgi:acetyltransferase
MKRQGLPVYTFPEEAAHALAALVRYRQWLARPRGRVVAFDDFDLATIRRVLERAGAEGRTALTLAEALGVLAAAKIPVAAWREAATPAEAGAVAEQMRCPVALKISAAAVSHKSDAGGVRLGLRSRDEVTEAAEPMLARARAGDASATLVVQRMVPAGTEVIVGASADPKFGPLLMFGLGGVFVEILHDVAFRVHPVSDVDVAEMIESIKGAPILHGARGHAAVDLASVREVLLRVNHLLTCVPDIQELDVNPFFAGTGPATSLAVDARICTRLNT